MGIKQTLKDNIGIVMGVIGIIGAVVGAAFFLEDRYVDEKEAERTYVKFVDADEKYVDEGAVVLSIRQQQQITDLHLLELWRERLRSIRNECQADPSNLEIQDRMERAKNNIEMIESRLYNNS